MIDATHDEQREVHKREEMEMTTDSHDRGSRRSHNQRKNDARAVGRKMSQEKFDREYTKENERLGIIMELLHESNEDQRCVWNVKTKVKWPIVHLFMRKLMHNKNVFLSTEEKMKKKGKHKMSAWMEEEKPGGAEFR
jgi:hypothetical protein